MPSTMIRKSGITMANSTMLWPRWSASVRRMVVVAHWNFGSFFMVESTVIVMRPDGKNGRMSGVKNVHV